MSGLFRVIDAAPSLAPDGHIRIFLCKIKENPYVMPTRARTRIRLSVRSLLCRIFSMLYIPQQANILCMRCGRAMRAPTGTALFETLQGRPLVVRLCLRGCASMSLIPNDIEMLAPIAVQAPTQQNKRPPRGIFPHGRRLRFSLSFS